MEMVKSENEVSVLEFRVAHLHEILDTFPKLLVAYSGGVDSAFLLCAAYRRLGERVLGVIADSPSLPRSELTAAIRLADRIGAPLKIIHTEEFTDSNYLKNSPDRCYFCKHALFKKMEELAVEWNFPVLAYGENVDDVSEWRPGAKAATEFQVRAPLKEASLSKANIRTLSAQWGLPTANKPSSPCLSSRIPHGTPVTTEALIKIEDGEAAIRSLGFSVFRLRHYGTRARLEFAPNELGRAQIEPWRSKLIQAVSVAGGYREIEIDPNGYRNTIR